VSVVEQVGVEAVDEQPIAVKPKKKRKRLGK